MLNASMRQSYKEIAKNQRKNQFLLFFRLQISTFAPTMENVIKHDGVIESIADGHVRVRILQTSACVSCKVASHCHTAEAKEKIIDVTPPLSEESPWHEGQQVTVTARSSMVGKALLISFGGPLVLMATVLVSALAAGCNEGVSALLMLGSLIPYYFVVWLCRHRIARQISFQIEQQTN